MEKWITLATFYPYEN